MQQIRGATAAGLGTARLFRPRRIADNRFKVTLVAFRGLRTVITGEVTPTEFGARVAITIRMNGAYTAFLMAFVIGLSWAAGGARPAAVLAMIAGLSVGFVFEARRAAALVRTLLLPAPPEGHIRPAAARATP